MKTIYLFIFTLVLLFGCKEKDNSLVAWWNFDSEDNGIIRDMSGNGFDAVSHSAVFREGRTGKALYGDGKGYLEVKYSPEMDNFKDGITISVWINRDRDSSKAYNCVVTREVRDTWSEYFDIAVVNNKPLLAIDADGNNYKQTECSDSIPLNQWVHLAGTFNNTTMRLYINGQEAASLAYEKPFNFSDQNPLIIGSNTNDQGKSMHDFFFGYLDDLKIYNRPLSDEEIKELAR